MASSDDYMDDSTTTVTWRRTRKAPRDAQTVHMYTKPRTALRETNDAKRVESWVTSHDLNDVKDAESREIETTGDIAISERRTTTSERSRQRERTTPTTSPDTEIKRTHSLSTWLSITSTAKENGIKHAE